MLLLANLSAKIRELRSFSTGSSHVERARLTGVSDHQETHFSTISP